MVYWLLTINLATLDFLVMNGTAGEGRSRALTQFYLLRNELSERLMSSEVMSKAAHHEMRLA